MMHTGSLDQADSTNSRWLATICIQACENIIILCEDMYKRGLLAGGNWLTTRALFSSTLTLFYVALSSRDPGLLQTRSICTRLALGRKVSDSLAKRSGLAHRWKVMMTVRCFSFRRICVTESIQVMIATLPSSARHIQEKLLSLDSMMADLALYKNQSQTPDHVYTTSLGTSALNLLGSDSSTADKVKWLAPHHLEALGLGCPEHVDCRSPSCRLDLESARDNIGLTDVPQLDTNNIGDYFLGSNAPGASNELTGMPLETEAGFGDLDEFLDLQNWL